jgi:opacity protein-like surface antigen
MTLKQQLFATCVLGLAVLGCNRGRAQDAGRFRPYLKFYDGDLEPAWGVKDHWSLGLGANLNQYLGVEWAFDYYVKDWGRPQVVGQASSYHFVPELRLRYPLLHNRLVPYLLAGLGPSWVQSKDGNPVLPRSDAQGWTWTASIGGGLEYFIQDNISVGLEGRYNFVNSIEGNIAGRSVPVDMSAALLTFGLRVYFDENHPQLLYSQEPAPGGRVYFGVRAGGDILTDDRLGGRVKLDPEQAAWGGIAGQDGALLFGLDWGGHFGAEIAGESVNHIIDVQGLGQVVEYGQGWVLANFRVRFPYGRLAPYVYAGPGVCYAEVKERKAPADGFDMSGSKWNPAFNIGGGLDYFITRRFALNADARWAYSWNHSFEMSNGISVKGDMAIAGITLGFKVYLFDL